MKAAVEALQADDSKCSEEMANASMDLFHAGICNLSRHSNFTPALLLDLAFFPGENTEFFSDGDFKGTPLRTLPARVRPGIKLGDEYYFTDGQFVRDAAYRTIQRGLLATLPEYREDWKTHQQEMLETALPTICARQFDQATKHCGVFYRDVTTRKWRESDLVITQDDVLLVVEAKAGAMPMHSPETNFDSFERIIRELVLKAFEQCKHFLEYLASAPEVKVYHFIDGRYVPIRSLRRRDFRTVLPIGLTVESFTPFSAMAKAHPDVRPLLGKYPFISMSVDDLFVLNRFLPTTGDLLHYLEVRQRTAGFPTAMIFDEIDHLGAYIGQNRFDMEIEKRLKQADLLWMDSFCDIVDRHFEREDWDTHPVPRQSFPQELTAVLAALDERRPKGWLMMDSSIRDRSSDARQTIADALADPRTTLQARPVRRFIAGGEAPIEICMCRNGMEPTKPDTHRSGQISCLAANKPHVLVLVLSFLPNGKIVNVACHRASAPTVLQIDYPELATEAERRRAMIRSPAPLRRTTNRGRPGRSKK